MRSRAVILPRECWRSTAAALPAWNAASRRRSSSSSRSFIDRSTTDERLVATCAWQALPMDSAPLRGQRGGRPGWGKPEVRRLSAYNRARRGRNN